MRQKRVHGDKEWFYLQEVISEYAKNILTCTEKTLKAYKRIWRIRPKGFDEYEEWQKSKKI